MSSTSKNVPAPVIDLVNDEDVWDALDEAENAGLDKGKGKEERKPNWMPKEMEPILEELPKWNLLSEIIQEAEGEIIRQESLRRPLTIGEYFPRKLILYDRDIILLSVNPSSNTILVMASSTRICSVISEFLSSMDQDAPPGSKGRRMMLRKLRLYLWWKGQLSKRRQDGKSHFGLPNDVDRPGDGFENMYGNGEGVSEALKKKDKMIADKAASRRRVRGGAPAAAVPSGRDATKGVFQETVIGDMQNEADNFAEL